MTVTASRQVWDLRAPARRYRFTHAVHMEWIKLRSLRSTWVTLAITGTGATALAAAVGVNTENAAGDLTNNALAGIVPGLLTIGVLGVLVMTGEYSCGTIRSTLAAIPNRPLLLAAKAAVFGAVTLPLGEAAAFVAFFAGSAALPGTVPPPTLGQPGVLRAVVLSGAGICLIGLLGLGLGAIVRHTGAAVAVLVGGVFVGAQILAATAPSAMGYVPISIVANSLGMVERQPEFLSPWAGLGVLCLYVAVTLGIGGGLFARRDA
jgi:ABC-2 type transport system permease protein